MKERVVAADQWVVTGAKGRELRQTIEVTLHLDLGIVEGGRLE